MEAPAFTPLQQQLNETLAELLAASGCQGGRLLMRPFDADDNPGIVGIMGYRPGAEDLEVWPLPDALLALLDDYDAEMPPGRDYLTLDVALHPPTFTYHHASAEEQAQAEATELTGQIKERYRYLQQHLSPDPYGPELAAQVAAALAPRGWLGYGHPAYCGMGFEMQHGQYHYGYIWEGSLKPLLTFADAAAFSAWLAPQSDLSLALLDKADYTLWDNQTVTRARLLELVQPPAPANN